MGGFAYSTEEEGVVYSSYRDVRLQDGYVWSNWSTYTGSAGAGVGHGQASITVYFKDGTAKNIASFDGYVHKGHQVVDGSALSVSTASGFSRGGNFENCLTKEEISNIDFIRCTAGVTHRTDGGGNVTGQAYVYALKVPWINES